MAINNFVYWSDELEGRAFDYHRRNGGRVIYQKKLPAGPGIWGIFSNARGMPGGLPGEGDARGWNWLAHYCGAKLNNYEQRSTLQAEISRRVVKQRSE